MKNSKKIWGGNYIKIIKFLLKKIVITFPQQGSFHVQVIFQSDEFNNLDKNEFIEKFKNDPEFKELSNLKDIHEDVIMGGVKLSADMLDLAGNRNNGRCIGEQKGGEDYDSPIGWNGTGLKVNDKFDDGDNTWIGMNNSPGEWCVAYHGVGSWQSSDNVKDITSKIVKTQFKAGGDKHIQNVRINFILVKKLEMEFIVLLLLKLLKVMLAYQL